MPDLPAVVNRRVAQDSNLFPFREDSVLRRSAPGTCKFSVASPGAVLLIWEGFSGTGLECVEGRDSHGERRRPPPWLWLDALDEWAAERCPGRYHARWRVWFVPGGYLPLPAFVSPRLPLLRDSQLIWQRLGCRGVQSVTRPRSQRTIARPSEIAGSGRVSISSCQRLSTVRVSHAAR
jgi:hypothetical protein